MSENRYALRLKPVTRHIEKHYKQALDLNGLAQLACLSPYHFHRVFKAVCGETPADMVRRLRLQAAANELFYGRSSVVEVALEYRFSSSQALAKAFKKHFGISPSDIQKCSTVPELNRLLENSKIGHALRKFGHDYAGRLFYDDGVNQTDNIRRTAMKIDTFPKTAVAYVRVTGPYGEGYDKACETLFRWAGPEGLAGGDTLFIYHDNPEMVPEEQCRTDVCLVVPEGTQPPSAAGIEFQYVPAGRYATMRKMITDYKDFAPAWDELMSQVVESEFELEDRPCFEYYHAADPSKPEFDTTFFTAVK